MEQKFDINRVIERYDLNREDVAKVLFPHAKYYKFAFDRVLKGEASLNTEQLEALAKLAGVMIHDLFTFEDWKGSSEDGCVVLLKGDYKVKLNYKGVYVSLYKGTNLIHQELSLKSMSMDEFTEYINQIINKQNQQDETN